MSRVATAAPARVADGLATILLAALLFGAMAVCVRVAAAEMPPAQVAFVRFVGSALVLIGVAGWRAVRPRAAPARVLVLRGLLGGGAIVLWFYGIRDAGVALATVIHCAYPVFAALLAAPLLGERVSRATAAALALQVAGAATVAGGDVDLSAATTRGVLASVAAAVLAGAATVTARHLRAGESATVVTTWFMLTGAAMTAPALATGVPSPSASLVTALAAIILLSAAAQWLLHQGLGTTTAARAGLAAATQMVVAASLEALVLGARMTPRLVAGGALMVAAVVLSRPRDGGASPPEAPPA